MDITKANPNLNKILFFSDLHLGVHQNSSSWHQTCLQVAEFINSTMKEKSLDTIIFAGDTFHDRHEVGVNTLSTAKRFFDILADYNIHIIPGNHDAFLSTTSEVNSVDILANNNIRVHSKPTVVQFGARKILFCPWKSSVKSTLSEYNILNADVIVGHFEIINFKMNANKICDHGESASDLLANSECVITGHFHCRELRKYEDKYVLYLGSPYEMDFGDREQKKGVTILDLNDLSTEFVENNTTPKHYRLTITDLIQKKYKDLPALVKNNIVSIYVDVETDALTIDLLVSKLSQYEPFQLRTEFNILDKASNVDQTKELEKLSLDIETAFSEFVEHIETRATKREVLAKCIELFRTSQATVE
jgi:DNA repair exonuclease SbcCD nuclease subunit